VCFEIIPPHHKNKTNLISTQSKCRQDLFSFRFRMGLWVNLEDEMFIMEGGSARIASLLFVFKTVKFEGELS